MHHQTKTATVEIPIMSKPFRLPMTRRMNPPTHPRGANTVDSIQSTTVMSDCSARTFGILSNLLKQDGQRRVSSLTDTPQKGQYRRRLEAPGMVGWAPRGVSAVGEEVLPKARRCPESRILFRIVRSDPTGPRAPWSPQRLLRSRRKNGWSRGKAHLTWESRSPWCVKWDGRRVP